MCLAKEAVEKRDQQQSGYGKREENPPRVFAPVGQRQKDQRQPRAHCAGHRIHTETETARFPRQLLGEDDDGQSGDTDDPDPGHRLACHKRDQPRHHGCYQVTEGHQEKGKEKRPPAT